MPGPPTDRIWAVLAALLALQWPSQSSAVYCSGQYVLTSGNGTIADHTGADNYPDNANCEWIIQPNTSAPVSVIAFTFAKFSTEFSYDFLRFYVGNTTTMVREYSGYQLPPSFQIQASSVRVQFQSDLLVNALGFRFSYSAGDCPAACSGRGLCWNNACRCDPGWSGANCSTPVCAVDAASGLMCAGRGQCVDGGCVCEPGYYGGACGDVYCTASGGQARMTAWNATFSDHRLTADGDGTDYWPATSCSWLITPDPPADSVVLRFGRVFTQPAVDRVSVFDQLSSIPLAVATTASATAVVGIAEGTPDPDSLVFVSTTGVMRVEFISDASWQALGWEASYQAVNCSQHCNGHGACHGGTCICRAGWSGDACQTGVAGCADNSDCSFPNGQCVGSGAAAACVCAGGWADIDCGLPVSASRTGPWPCSVVVRDLTASSGFVRVNTAQSHICTNRVIIAGGLPNNGASIVLRPSYFDVLPLAQSTTGFAHATNATSSSLSGISQSATMAATGGGLLTTGGGPVPSAALTQTATVVVYNGTTTSSPILTLFTLGGSRRGDLSGLVPPVATSGSSMLVVVYQQSGAGYALLPAVFSARYDLVYCPSNCSSRGVCRAGRCYCAVGFAGGDCSQPVCPGGCNGFGTCVNGTCRCLPGFYGRDCRSRFCSGRTVVSAASGTIREHVGGGRYMPNMVCEWLIEAASAAWLTGFVTTAFQIYYDPSSDASDQVLMFVGPGGANETWTPVSDFLVPELGLPSPVSVEGAAVLVRFQSNYSSTFRQLGGFALSYQPQDSCPSYCTTSGPSASPGLGQACRGTCVNTTCLCASPFTGPDCSQSPAPSVAIAAGATYAVTVDNWQWRFFQIRVNVSLGLLNNVTPVWNPRRLNLYGIKASNRGGPEFYLMNSTEPTTQTQRKLLYFDDRLGHQMFEPPPGSSAPLSPGVWYLGVYGRQLLQESSMVANFSVSFSCINDCQNNGFCSPQGGCQCYDSMCWTGVDCSRPVVSCGVNQACRAGVCSCAAGWNGTDCQTPICTQPCLHGGRCDRPFHCDCSGTGYIGATCNVTPICLPTCLNGGVCYDNNMCNCTGTGFYGSSCQTPVQCSAGFCLNNSTCNGTSRCQCSQLWTGNDCGTAECWPRCTADFRCNANHECIAAPPPSNSSSQVSAPEARQSQEMLIGLVVALSCTILGLGAIIIAILILRPHGCRRGRVGQALTAGVAGGGEEF